MPLRRPDPYRIVPGLSAWRPRGALHLVTAVTVVTILLLFLLHVTSDHARSVRQDLATKSSVAELAVQQTQAVLGSADSAVASLRREGTSRSPPAVSQPVGGVRWIRLVPADRLSMAAPIGTVLTDRVVTDRTATRTAIMLDSDWLARRPAATDTIGPNEQATATVSQDLRRVFLDGCAG